jgi:arylsulfatase A-like enzyme
VQHDFPRRHYFDSPAPCDPAGIADARRAYAAAVTYLDYQLNRLIHGLYEHGVWGNTAILFVSDHGDMLYDHHFIAKALPFEGAARIPFLLRLPRGHALATAADGTRRREPVELRDVMPTLLDLAEAPQPSGLDGRSVLDLLRNRDGWRETLHGEHVNGDWSNQWITDGRYKYCWFTQTGRELLFDLEQDPREEHDLAGSEAALLARLRQSLVRELANRPEGFVQEGRLVHGRPQSPVLPWVGEGGGP